MQEIINEPSKYDMATAGKAIGEFAGTENENIDSWLKTVDVICELAEMNEEIKLKIVVFAMRDQAKIWASDLLYKQQRISWQEFKRELRARFSSQKETTEILSRFFTRPQARSYEEFVSLLKDAELIHDRGCINAEPLMKQVITRCPVEIKSILLQAGINGCNWNTFIKYAENSGWIAFPEKIINNVQENKYVLNNYKTNNYKSNIKTRDIKGKN